jgi:AraC-like DNA-binding protein
LQGRQLAALALESATAAELALFAAFLLVHGARRSPALYLLSGLAFLLAAVIGGNLAIAGFGWSGLAGLVLLFDLLIPPAAYLYVRQMPVPAPAMRVRDLAHTAAAIVGVLAWIDGLVPSMDVYVNAVWLAYLGAMVFRLSGAYQAYAPVRRQISLVVLSALLAIIETLRLVIVTQSDPASFQQGIPYLFILGAGFVLAAHLLYTAMAYPSLLSAPGSYIKYAQSLYNREHLHNLATRIRTYLDGSKAYLDPDFDLAAIAIALDVPAREVSQAINLRAGMNVAAYLNMLRAMVAAELLTREPDMPIKIVAHKAGFKTKSVFNREFQRHFGKSPSEYREGRAKS